MHVRKKNAGYLINILKIAKYFKKNNKKLSDKRNKIQAIGKCSDEEIFSLFSPLIIVPKSVKKFDFIPRFFLKLINVYIFFVKIKVSRLRDLYYY